MGNSRSSDDVKRKYPGERLILAVDPGRDKCGIAVMNCSLSVKHRNIVTTINIESYLRKLNNNYNIGGIVIGDGTYSDRLYSIIKEIFEVSISIVDEAYTTVEAEKRYFREHKRGWQRWFPFIRWKPSVPVDDYVAIILAERYIKERGRITIEE